MAENSALVAGSPLELKRSLLSGPDFFTSVTIIFSHAGFPLYDEIWPIIKRSPRIFVDLSSHHVDKRIVKKVVRYLGVDHCLFGTDDPYGNINAGIWIQNWIEMLDITKKQKDKIFSGNFQSIISHL